MEKEKHKSRDSVTQKTYNTKCKQPGTGVKKKGTTRRLRNKKEVHEKKRKDWGSRKGVDHRGNGGECSHDFWVEFYTVRPSGRLVENRKEKRRSVDKPRKKNWQNACYSHAGPTRAKSGPKERKGLKKNGLRKKGQTTGGECLRAPAICASKLLRVGMQIREGRGKAETNTKNRERDRLPRVGRKEAYRKILFHQF